MQASFLPVRVLREVDSTFDGADLKRIARGEDGFDYAMKRIQEHPHLPLCEWVSYHLCRAVGIQTPDFAVLDCGDTLPPAFGSRIEYTKQIDKTPSGFAISPPRSNTSSSGVSAIICFKVCCSHFKCM